MNYIPRVSDWEILAFIEDGQTNKNVLLVEGARQVGKSFLVEHALRRSPKKSMPAVPQRTQQSCPRPRPASTPASITYSLDWRHGISSCVPTRKARGPKPVTTTSPSAICSIRGCCGICAKWRFRPFGY
jgi:hypothetical protein